MGVCGCAWLYMASCGFVWVCASGCPAANALPKHDICTAGALPMHRRSIACALFPLSHTLFHQCHAPENCPWFSATACAIASKIEFLLVHTICFILLCWLPVPTLEPPPPPSLGSLW